MGRPPQRRACGSVCVTCEGAVLYPRIAGTTQAASSTSFFSSSDA